MTSQYINPHMHDKVFDYIKKAYEDHDKSCSSIPEMWLGCLGGFSSLNEQAMCDGCEVSFYWDGIKEIETEDTNWFFCDCCFRNIKDKVMKNGKD